MRALRGKFQQGWGTLKCQVNNSTVACKGSYKSGCQSEYFGDRHVDVTMMSLPPSPLPEFYALSRFSLPKFWVKSPQQLEVTGTCAYTSFHLPSCVKPLDNAVKAEPRVLWRARLIIDFFKWGTRIRSSHMTGWLPVDQSPGGIQLAWFF